MPIHTTEFKMIGDFSPEQVSAFSEWANAQRIAYITKLNEEHTRRKLTSVAQAPIGTKYTIDKFFEQTRGTVIAMKCMTMLYGMT